ncbi:MAG: M20/M25/M40 family metallo-hydrolase [candidate division KSB1 bacterium]|nr:M20/M25/M40 family metallo-hydrolase [candidate division KSB1 bacterium]MDZ7336046.1 M20/M25/M40 family metallo-hydrolase [candidate division KSB1 bacterium]MDZ7358066.1 M20/M25/M40 family metallo-hydrolase [candidate division KSB1 bacterium]MDZ7402231.1 M20/M25/M40 family metallo-hydrolase [candidate division KSB1 bacterium]
MDILDDPVAVLQKYLRINTTNSQNDLDACSFWSAIFSRYHIKNQILHIEDYHNFETYTDSPASERILLHNHLDVVSANPANWEHDPFGGHIEGGFLYGRGALDMKSIAVAQAYAMIRLSKENHPRSKWIKFCSLVQEETTSEFGAKFYVHHLAKHGYQNLIVLGEGGFGVRLPEIFDGYLLLYESEQKGLLWLTITVHSCGGHGSLSGPRKNANPVLRAAKVAEKLSSYRFPIKIEQSVRYFISHLLDQSHHKLIRSLRLMPGFELFLFNTKAGANLLNRVMTRATGIPDMFRTSLNVTNISTDKIEGIEEKRSLPFFSLRRIFGRSPKRKINPITRMGINVIPNYATITCDIRFSSIYNPESLVQLIRTIIPKDADMRIIHSQEFSSSNYRLIHDPVQQELARFSKERFLVSPFLFLASSDNYFFRKHGHHAYGLMPIVVPIEELQRIHGDNERINIQDFRQGCEAYYRILKSIVESINE